MEFEFNITILDVSAHIAAQLPFEGEFGIAEIGSLSQDALDRLNPEEKEELNSFTNVKRQREYLSSRIALKEMAGKMGVGTSGFAILKDELGQPYGTYKSDRYYISIAHSDHYVFCGITENAAIGIDLEPVSRKVPEKLKQRILHPGEGELFTDVNAIRMWTLKEAYIKLRGQGLRLNMREVCVQKDREAFSVEINNDKSAKICSFQLENNWLAIAYYQ